MDRNELTHTTTSSFKPWSNKPSHGEEWSILELCKQNRWKTIDRMISAKPEIALYQLTMKNRITTTILHQAITSRSREAPRVKVMERILETTPQAASIKNGFGSHPLHVIAQRNTKMTSMAKEELIAKMIQAFPAAIVTKGGKGERTPLHVLFTDYISTPLARMMLEAGKEACFMQDKRGYLAAHVACARHCSPEKLDLLLQANPSALYAKTKQGDTLLSLAVSTATKSHPNTTLIQVLEKRLGVLHQPLASPLSSPRATSTISAALFNKTFVPITPPVAVRSVAGIHDMSDESDGSWSPGRVHIRKKRYQSRSLPLRKRKVALEKEDDKQDTACLLLHLSRGSPAWPDLKEENEAELSAAV